MINIPIDSFKHIEVGDEEPFVREAIRPRKHYELCWCGSGLKYKKCHQVRGNLVPLPLERVLHEQKKIFWRKRGCMHPSASRDVCRGVIVDAHTIQRKGPLSAIVDDRNHVCKFEPDNSGGVAVQKIGWKKASTFPGFCAFHDSEVFAMIEREPFIGSHEQCVLQAYRCISNELYKKRALLESLQYQRSVADRGLPFHEQLDLQFSCYLNRGCSR